MILKETRNPNWTGLGFLTVGVLLIVASTPDECLVRLIARHGGVVDANRPQNSAAALDEAIRRGYWMVEADIQESRDGHTVMHCGNLEQSYGEKRFAGQLEWQEIRKLHSIEDGSCPLEFAEYAARCRNRIQLMINIPEPNHPFRFYEDVERVLRDNRQLGGTYVIGARDALDWFKNKTPVGVSRKELEKILLRGEDPQLSYFLFERVRDFDSSSSDLSRRAGVPAIISIDRSTHDDALRLLAQGIQYFEIDSESEQWFRANQAVP